MKRTARTFLVLLCVLTLTVNTYAAQKLVPVGEVVGLSLQDDTLTVCGFDEALGSQAKDSGLQLGDQLLKIDGKPVKTPQDVKAALKASGGFVLLQLRRGGKDLQLQVKPQITDQGPKLGVLLKQGITGIGTVTFYDPETGKFGALGHGVSTADGSLLEMVSGQVYEAAVASVKPGKIGKPGLLRGAAKSQEPVGTISKNTQQGVFGTAQSPWQGQALEVAQAQEITTGKATILSTVSGQLVREYSVEILKIYPLSRTAGRNFLIRVTDPALLEATGGIVQGMSGSPIIQNGKLIGAVTHVLVNDPTTGYGIFIENMLDAAA